MRLAVQDYAKNSSFLLSPSCETWTNPRSSSSSQSWDMGLTHSAEGRSGPSCISCMYQTKMVIVCRNYSQFYHSILAPRVTIDTTESWSREIPKWDSFPLRIEKFQDFRRRPCYEQSKLNKYLYIEVSKVKEEIDIIYLSIQNEC
jgi:hypothetical protein